MIFEDLGVTDAAEVRHRLDYPAAARPAIS